MKHFITTKRLLLIIVLLLALPALAAAATLEVIWEYDDVVPVDTFILYETLPDNTSVEVASWEGTLRVGQFIQDIDTAPGAPCHTYYLRAVNNGAPSDPSNPYAWCPEGSTPDYILRPGQPININIRIIDDAVPVQ